MKNIDLVGNWVLPEEDITECFKNKNDHIEIKKKNSHKERRSCFLYLGHNFSIYFKEL